MSSLIGQQYQYTSGTGSNMWTYNILISSTGVYTAQIVDTPLGAATYDLLEIPESVLNDIVSSITTLKAGGATPTG